MCFWLRAPGLRIPGGGGGSRLRFGDLLSQVRLGYSVPDSGLGLIP